MKIKNEAWLGEKPPTKDEIERLYKLCYTVDQAYFKKEDVIELGLDLHRLKEFGEVRMKKNLSELRKHVSALWKRMNGSQRAAYIMGDAMSSLDYFERSILELEKILGSLPEVHEGVHFIKTGLMTRTSHLGDRLKKGSGKWKSDP